MRELEITETLSSIKPYYYRVKEFRDQLPDHDTLTERWHDMTRFMLNFNAVTSEWFDRLDSESEDEQFVAQMSDKVTALEFCCHDALQHIDD